jgi:hypothetical protein
VKVGKKRVSFLKSELSLKNRESEAYEEMKELTEVIKKLVSMFL